ncbi:MAG: hypothetical protein Q8Q09_08210 [Deltaproteobacteria bacterium]|nr:hypothetical protein [Deltaproteobacteria bacterium]
MQRTTIARALVGLTLSTAALSQTSCAEVLNQLRSGQGTGAMRPPDPPQVTVAAVRLTRAPRNEQIANYFCQRALNQSLGPLAGMVCQVFGPAPRPEDMQFQFTTDLDFRNPNQIPLPLVEILAAFTVFPAATGERNLGAVCLNLCQDPATCPPAQDACRSDQRDIRTMQDFAGAAVNFLVGVATGQNSLENLRIRTLAPGATTRAQVHLQLDPQAVLAVLEHVANGAVQQAQRGQQVRFDIPYRFEGTVWLRVENFGRFAATVPPFTGTWQLDQVARDAAQPAAQR